MGGREFLVLAQELLNSGTHERHWRAAIIHAYYGLLLECRDSMSRWGLPPPSRHQVHSQVRLRLLYATDADLQASGRTLDILGTHRNLANYEMQPRPQFSRATIARQDVREAAAALGRLDAIDADPARRAAAIAAIRP